MVAAPQALDWMHDEAAAFARARSEGKGVVVDFYATWCTPCVDNDRWLATRDVHDVIAPNFVALRFDVSADSDEARQQRERYVAEVLPTVLFVDASGHVLQRVSRLLEADEWLDVARTASAKLRQSTPPIGAVREQ